MTRILATPSTNALWDFSGVQSFEEGAALPYGIAIDPGSWRFYRAAEGPVVTVTSASADFWTQGATGPYFVDPVNVPNPTSRIRHRWRCRVPTTIGLPTGNRAFAAQESNGFDVQGNFATAGIFRVTVTKLEGPSGETLARTGSIALEDLPRDTWITLEVDCNMIAGTIRGYRDGVLTGTETFTPPADPRFQGGREISFMAWSAGQNLLPAGLEFEFIESWFTDGTGAESLRKRITGNAATVNADPWKAGGDAA